jgi:hypothetical protein
LPPFLPFTSSKLLTSDSLQSSISRISESENADTIYNYSLSTQSMYGFNMILRVNSSHFTIQYSSIGLCNGDGLHRVTAVLCIVLSHVESRAYCTEELSKSEALCIVP